MTKTQVKNQLKKLIERLEDLRGDLEMLGDDAQETAYDIEPYDGKDELTEQQEERQDWMNETADAISEQVSNLEDVISNLDDLLF